MGAIAVEVDSPPQYGVLEGPGGSNKMLLRNLRLAHIYRRRMMRYESMVALPLPWRCPDESKWEL